MPWEEICLLDDIHRLCRVEMFKSRQQKMQSRENSNHNTNNNLFLQRDNILRYEAEVLGVQGRPLCRIE